MQPHTSAADGADEIVAALSQIKNSLEELADKCRSQGIDPATMIMKLMTGGSRQRGASVAAALRADATAVSRAAGLSTPWPGQPPSDAELTRRSRELIDGLDRGDVATVDAVLAHSFVAFRGGPPKDRDAVLATITQRTSTTPYIAKRTWGDELVVRKHDALVFIGKAHERQGGNETHGGYLYDGWYLLQWVRAGDAWCVQLLTWQKESAERDWWNDTFCNGRGFAHEPNRLLVDTVKDQRAGVALELAMGQGRNALYLASQGWNVTGVDIADEGLRIAREQAVKRKLALETILRDGTVDDVPDWGWDKGKLVRFVARKRQ